MLNPINFYANNKHNIKQENTSDKNYRDPLSKNWMVTLSFSNELGAAVYEIAPKLSQLLWIPPLMYLGADIYDKYKNDQNSYNPSGARAFEQAIYQGLSSFVFPTFAILTGQELTSPLGKLVNKGLSVNTKSATIKHINEAIDQCVGDIFTDKKKFKEFFMTSLDNKIRACKNEKRSDSFLKRIIKNLNGHYALANCSREKILNYASENVNTLIKIKDDLLANKKPSEISKKSFHKYLEEYPVLKQTYGEKYANNALRYSLKTFESRQLFANKLVKTLGGLIALVICIKPLDSFIQKKIMPNIVDTGLDRFNQAILEKSPLRLHIKQK